MGVVCSCDAVVPGGIIIADLRLLLERLCPLTTRVSLGVAVTGLA